MFLTSFPPPDFHSQSENSTRLVVTTIFAFYEQGIQGILLMSTAVFEVVGHCIRKNKPVHPELKKIWETMFWNINNPKLANDYTRLAP